MGIDLNKKRLRTILVQKARVDLHLPSKLLPLKIPHW
jgi:hypothetical protein